MFLHPRHTNISPITGLDGFVELNLETCLQTGFLHGATIGLGCVVSQTDQEQNLKISIDSILNKLMSFRIWLESEESENIKTTLARIPKKHQTLVNGFDYKFQVGNTMKGDDENIGQVDFNSKCITVAAPWHYAREFTVLHEIAHMVYETLSAQQKKVWDKLAKKLKNDPKRETQSQSSEELFCMAYANTYAKHKDKIHDHPEWEAFVLKLK